MVKLSSKYHNENTKHVRSPTGWDGCVEFHPDEGGGGGGGGGGAPPGGGGGGGAGAPEDESAGVVDVGALLCCAVLAVTSPKPSIELSFASNKFREISIRRIWCDTSRSFLSHVSANRLRNCVVLIIKPLTKARVTLGFTGGTSL